MTTKLVPISTWSLKWVYLYDASNSHHYKWRVIRAWIIFDNIASNNHKTILNLIHIASHSASSEQNVFGIYIILDLIYIVFLYYFHFIYFLTYLKKCFIRILHKNSFHFVFSVYTFDAVACNRFGCVSWLRIKLHNICRHWYICWETKLYLQQPQQQ